MFIGDSFRVPGKVRWTYIFIALNVFSFIVVTYRMNTQEVFMVGGIIPSEWFHASVPFSANRPPEFISMLWSFFLHGGWTHLIFNMIFLALFGPNLEARMGKLLFPLFYLSCASAGALLQVLYDTQSMIPIIGASGAIAGLLGGYFAIFRDHFIRVDFGQHARSQLIFPIYLIILFWLVSQVLHGMMTMLARGLSSFQPVAYFAHIGGFACGYVLARRLDKRAQKKRFKVFSGGNKDGV